MAPPAAPLWGNLFHIFVPSVLPSHRLHAGCSWLSWSPTQRCVQNCSREEGGAAVKEDFVGWVLGTDMCVNRLHACVCVLSMLAIFYYLLTCDVRHNENKNVEAWPGAHACIFWLCAVSQLLCNVLLSSEIHSWADAMIIAGFETCTIMLDGKMDHEDSVGNKGLGCSILFTLAELKKWLDGPGQAITFLTKYMSPLRRI